MNIAAHRVDERLVHGQIMTSWSKRLQLKRIVVVDDATARDEFMAQVLTMSAPAGITIDICSVEEAAERIKHDISHDESLVLYKRISAALDLARALKGGAGEMDALNIGNLGSAPGRFQVTKSVFLSDAEKNQIRELQKLGVDVFLQMLYSDPRVAVDEVI